MRGFAASSSGSKSRCIAAKASALPSEARLPGMTVRMRSCAYVEDAGGALAPAAVQTSGKLSPAWRAASRPCCGDEGAGMEV